jgi:hypothetical protein
MNQLKAIHAIEALDGFIELVKVASPSIPRAKARQAIDDLKEYFTVQKDEAISNR